ncbi:MAG: glycosyltransferase family 2 protein [Desulfomonile sp.]
MMLSVVIPIYNEVKNIEEYLRQVVPILEQITDDFEIIFALDPSSDRSEEAILEARASDSRIKLLKFSRRVGQPMATLAGLQYSSGEAVIVMDVDLQDPPELIPEMFSKYKEGYDVVLAQRRTRSGEHWFKRLVAYLGYKLINKIADVEITPNTGDFRLISHRVVDQINAMKESHGFLRGIVAYVGFKKAIIQFDRPPRYSGRGNYNRLLGSLRIGFNGLFCFSNYVLTLSSLVGFIIAGTSFLLGVVYTFLTILGAPFPIGNPTIVILVLLMGGIQLISVGILGEYLGRVYDEVRTRPRYIVDRSEGFPIVPDNYDRL